jgi:hypothetical protein
LGQFWGFFALAVCNTTSRKACGFFAHLREAVHPAQKKIKKVSRNVFLRSWHREHEDGGSSIHDLVVHGRPNVALGPQVPVDKRPKGEFSMVPSISSSANVEVGVGTHLARSSVQKESKGKRERLSWRSEQEHWCMISGARTVEVVVCEAKGRAWYVVSDWEPSSRQHGGSRFE